jgi:hypothetical protein
MRQIEQDIVNAARFGVSFHSGTSSNYVPCTTGYRDNLTFDKNTFSYKLWGNEIAKGNTGTKEIMVSDCGYPTATTTSRLNALFAGLDIPMAVSIRKKQIVYTIHGQEVKPGMLHYYAGDWCVTIAQEA